MRLFFVRAQSVNYAKQIKIPNAILVFFLIQKRKGEGRRNQLTGTWESLALLLGSVAEKTV